MKKINHKIDAVKLLPFFKKIYINDHKNLLLSYLKAIDIDGLHDLQFKLLQDLKPDEMSDFIINFKGDLDYALQITKKNNNYNNQTFNKRA